MLQTLKKFWAGIPTFGRAFMGVIAFAFVGAMAADLLLFFIPSENAQLIGLIVGLIGYAYLAIRNNRVL